jgi:hypothetical protein
MRIKISYRIQVIVKHRAAHSTPRIEVFVRPLSGPRPTTGSYTFATSFTAIEA